MGVCKYACERLHRALRHFIFHLTATQLGIPRDEPSVSALFFARHDKTDPKHLTVGPSGNPDAHHHKFRGSVKCDVTGFGREP